MGSYPDLHPLDRIPAAFAAHQLLLQHLYANALHRGLIDQAAVDRIIASVEDDSIRQLVEGFFKPLVKVGD